MVREAFNYLSIVKINFNLRSKSKVLFIICIISFSCISVINNFENYFQQNEEKIQVDEIKSDLSDQINDLRKSSTDDENIKEECNQDTNFDEESNNFLYPFNEKNNNEIFDFTIKTNSISSISNNDIVVDLEVPNSLKTGDSTIINATAENQGAINETNIKLQIWINDELIENQTIDNLNIGEIKSISYNWLQPPNGIYNITCFVYLVSNESILENNIISKYTTVSYGISFNLGDYIKFKSNSLDFFEPFWFNITYDSFIDDYLVNITLNINPNIKIWFAVDIITGEIMDYSYSQFTGQYFPYQRENSTFYIGANITWWDSLGTVTGETTYQYNDQIQDVWIVEFQESEMVIFYDKETGVVLYYFSTNSSEVGELFETNIIASIRYTHEIKLELEVPDLADPGDIVIINVTVSNIGKSNESNIVVLLFINDVKVDILGIEMFQNDTAKVLSSEWYFSNEGCYNITAEVSSVVDEKILLNNRETRNVSVFELINYNMQIGTNFEWIDATVGTLLSLGDDDSIKVNLSFNFRFYDKEFSSIYVSSNGWLSFYNNYPNDYNDHLPYYPSMVPADYYSVSLFNINLKPESNIYVLILNNPNRVVIEYHDIYYHNGEVAGRFEAVFYESGDIVFQYDYSKFDYAPTVGLNYGLNQEYYNNYEDFESNSNTENLSILFTTVSNPYISTTLFYPNGGEILTGRVTIDWTAHTNTNYNITHSIYLWNGTLWLNTLEETSKTEINWDTSFMEDRNDYILKIVSKAGPLTSEDESETTFEIKNNVEIDSESSLISAILGNVVSLVTNPFFYVILAEIGVLIILVQFLRKEKAVKADKKLK